MGQAAGFAALVAVGVTWSSGASAQSTGPDAQQRAESLVEQGVALRQRGDDDGALERFREAYALVPSARSLAQIALAEQAIGDWLRADRDLRQALAARDEPWIERNRGALSGALEQIARRIGTVDVRVNVPGAELWIDGARIGALPLTEPARVVAGAVLLEVRAEGFATLRRSVEVRGMALVRETFNLVRIAAEERPGSAVGPRSQGGTDGSGAASNVTASGMETLARSTPWARSSGGVSVGAVVVTASGAAALAAAGVFGALRGAAIGPCRIVGDTLVCPSEQAARAAEVGRTYTTLANVSLVAGGLAVAGGVAWIVASGLGARSAGARGAARVGWVVSPTIVATGAGLECGGTF